ncbi:hypothetical protein [Nocardia abscessus]|uniref:hypothetical protein n=1 Tax=Nocardia abscessus TaxID=120957 RepID=UPI0024558595|nr:hypothetical protein [Nocardia abscessus]
MPPGIEFGWRRHGEAVAVGRFGPPGLWITATGNLRLPLVEHDQGQAVEEDGGVCGQGIDNRHRPRRFRCDSTGQRSAYFSPHGLGQNEAILVTTHTGWARPDLEIHTELVECEGIGRGRGRLRSMTYTIHVFRPRRAPLTQHIAMVGSRRDAAVALDAPTSGLQQL